MSNIPAPAAPTAPQVPNNAPRRPRNRHRARGGRGGGENTPAVVPPGPAAVPQPLPASLRASNDAVPVRGGRGGGRSRGRGGRQSAAGLSSRPHTNAARTVQGGRRFGGQLTTEEDDTASQISEPQLSADAPAFIPGQPVVPKGPRPKAAPQLPRKRRMSKSTAPDIATRIHEDVENGHYECAVCTNEIYRNSKIWSCRTCWSIFHLSCVKKWASSQGSTMAQPQAEDGSIPPPRQWRCPGCNLPKDALPTTFTCWCEKEADPKPPPGIPPFSCGQTCSRHHLLPKECPHPCSELCHAGPCPPCPQKGPTQSCFCGRESVTRRCVDTDYKNGWSCGQICGELMPCGEHFCDRPCHEGLCGACEIRIHARCYCGQVEKDIICCEKGDEIVSSKTHVSDNGEELSEEWTGIFECGNTCDRTFDCGKHHCEKSCHKQDATTPHCPKSPDVVTHCPCGKTPLAEVTIKERTSCEDPISPCIKPCHKPLSCGHSCQKICHSGDCPPCMERISINCRCGRTASKSICHQGREEPPQCMRICRANLNCGRHECGEHCCTGERKAAERTKRKPRPLNAAPTLDGFEAEHICTRSCGRLLKCGTHHCQELCHKGPCGTCREAIFDEISCNCGRTVLQPPLPCGTRPPPCRFACERPRDCGHLQIPHNCHQDDESCPKCPFLTTKPCLCGKNHLKNQPCWLQDVRCGEVCGRKLKCGFHQCRKSCHKPGECEDSSQACQQLCSKEKGCGHPCEYKCHSPFACKEDKPCQYKIFITCDCQRIKQEAKCGATKYAEGNAAKSLKCDDECARLERNRKLALALNIDQEAHKDDHIPYQAETLNMYLENSAWAQIHEKQLRLFAADPEQKRLRFKPMKNHERAFIHSLAEDFGFDSESMDPDPHRHVAIFKTPRFVMAPMKTLAECARIRQIQRAMTTGTITTTTETAKAKAKASNVVGDPFNAFVLTQARFGLTVEELRSAINPALFASGNAGLQFDISFLPNEDIVLVPLQQRVASDRALETTLSNLKPALAKALSNPSSLGRLQLCRVDESLNIERRESDSASSGWSQVAAKAAAPRRDVVRDSLFLGGPKNKNNFAVFATAASRKKTASAEENAETESGKVAFEKLKMVQRQESVDEDWMEAEEREEEKERLASRGNSAGNSAMNSGDEGVGPEGSMAG